MKDCRDCQQWETCPCEKPGHDKDTSIGYLIGECKDYEPNLIRCADCKLRFTNKCVLHDQPFPINKGNDWFCADGERNNNKERKDNE